MRGELTLYIDQYGNHWRAKTVSELRKQIGGRLSKMYRDTEKGAVHCGYVIGQHWLTAFRPVEIPA